MFLCAIVVPQEWKIVVYGNGLDVQVVLSFSCWVLQDLMNGKVIFRNIMSILMLGVNTVMEQRTSQLYGPALEDAISLCLQILLSAFSKDSLFAEYWRPIYQPIDVILSHDIRQIVALLEFVRYDPLPQIQRYSVQIMKILSLRMPHLVSVIIEAGAASSLIEDYAACLETRADELQAPESPDDDIGSLILQVPLSFHHCIFLSPIFYT
jgi:nuclear pore complex protein Nup205